MAGNQINIESINAVQIGDMDVITLTVDDYDHAMQVLRKSAYGGRLFGQSRIHQDEKAIQALLESQLQPVSPEAILVQLPDKPGALAEITSRFRQAKVGLRSIRIAHRAGDRTIIAISSDSPEEARQLVRDNLVS
jgi:hypothetical protein